jgi:magnesium transporter
LDESRENRPIDYRLYLTRWEVADLPIAELSEAIPQILGIALTALTDDERQMLETIYQQHLPTSKEVREIEVSARIYEDEESLHIHSFFFQKEDHHAITTAVAFTLTGNRIVPLHDQPIPLFRLLRLRARRERELIQDPLSLLLALFELKIEHLADQLEATQLTLETISQTVDGRGPKFAGSDRFTDQTRRCERKGAAMPDG